MKPNTGKTILGGLIGTLMFASVEYSILPLFLGNPLEVAEIVNLSWGEGIVVQFLIGVVAIPLVFSHAAYRCSPRSPVAKGLVFGLTLWLLVETIIAPLAGGGVFHASRGGFIAVMGSLMCFVMYGVLLGWISGGPANDLKPEAIRRAA